MTSTPVLARAVRQLARRSLALLALTAATARAQPPARHAVGVTPVSASPARTVVGGDVTTPRGRDARPWNHAFVGALVGVPLVTVASASVMCATHRGNAGSEGNECGLAAAILGPPAGLYLGGTLGYAHGIASARGCDAHRTTLLSGAALVLVTGATVAVVAALDHAPGVDRRSRQLMGAGAAIGGLVIGASTAAHVARRCTPRSAQ